MEKTDIISAALERIEKLEKWRDANADLIDKDKHKGKEKEEADEEVCQECGGDLLFVEEGIAYCPKCKDYYDIKEGEEEE